MKKVLAIILAAASLSAAHANTNLVYTGEYWKNGRAVYEEWVDMYSVTESGGDKYVTVLRKYKMSQTMSVSDPRTYTHDVVRYRVACFYNHGMGGIAAIGVAFTRGNDVIKKFPIDEEIHTIEPDSSNEKIHEMVCDTND